MTQRTGSTIQAGIVYRETQQQIYQAMDMLKARLNAHQAAVQASGTNWQHVEDLEAIVASLHALTQSN
jgi:uncharacterized protein YukE